MPRRSGRASEPGSWAEMIRTYEAEKRSVGTQSAPAASSARVAAAEARAKRMEESCAYDPVCHRFRDPVKEKSTVEEERKKSVKLMNSGLDKARAQEASYDIITQKLHPSSQPSQAVEQKKAIHRSGATYNIVNLEGSAPEVKAPQPQRPRLSTQFQRPLDYDIISNRYFANHDDRSKSEEESRKLEIARKYSRHKTFNPIKGTYYIDKINREMEQEEKKDKEKRSKDSVKTSLKQSQTGEALPNDIHQMYQQKSLTDLLSSDGYMYNITTLAVKRPDVLQARDEEAKRKKEPWQLRYRAEAKFYEEGIKEAELAKIRAANRVSVSRTAENVKHGYNIISHEVSTLNEVQKKTFDGRRSLWDQIRGSS